VKVLGAINPKLVLLGLMMILGFADAAFTGLAGNVPPGLLLGVGSLLGLLVVLFDGKNKAANIAVAERLERLSQGDYSVSLEPKPDGVSEQLAAQFDQLVSHLAANRTHNDSVASELTALYQSLQNSVGLVGQCNASDSAHEVTSAIDELGAAVEEIANNAASAADSTHQAMAESENGKVTMTEALGSMASLTDHIARAGDAVARLGKESQNIGAVLDVIRGIAEQTNLLALNAAIEAARAGEQGRGFAVVADEVRTLASRTQQSTQEIQEMIEALQSKAKEAETTMAEGTDQVGVVEEMIEGACVSLAEIAAYVQTIDGMNTTIASAAEQQSVAVTSIREVVHANHTQANLAGDVLNQLSQAEQQIQVLQQLLGRF